MIRSCTVVIPARNEATTIGDLVSRCLANHADHVVVVDDASTDKTRKEAELSGAAVFAMPVQRKAAMGMVGVYTFGLAIAVQGKTAADVIIEMDAGGSHDPASIPEFLTAIANANADIATGNRFAVGGSFTGSPKRSALSSTGTLLFNLRHGTTFQDATSGFIAYRGDALRLLLNGGYKSRGHFYQSEVRRRALELGMRVREVPIHYKSSGSSLNWKSIGEAVRLLVTG